ncbi:MAG: hypothetical protein V3V61_07965 [Gammaproteobacteria bacterium]
MLVGAVVGSIIGAFVGSIIGFFISLAIVCSSAVAAYKHYLKDSPAARKARIEASTEAMDSLNVPSDVINLVTDFSEESSPTYLTPSP